MISGVCGCGKAVRQLVQGLCRTCYMKKTYGEKYWQKWPRAKSTKALRWRPPAPPEGSSCAICGAVEKLRADHDHSSCRHKSPKKVCPKCFRGWLCLGCNLLLGWAKDHPVILRKAADYLERKEDE